MKSDTHRRKGKKTARNHSIKRPQADTPRQPIIGFVNLGCAKNTVDSERLLGQLASDGCLISEDLSQTDVILVNTCGFIEPARRETADVLKELAVLRDAGQVKKIIALGCMVQRAVTSPDTAGILKDADIQVGFSDYKRISDIVTAASEKTLPKKKAHLTSSYSESIWTDFQRVPRLRIGSPHSAYLKISEGCGNTCGFCSIPSIRGPHVSVPMDNLIEEARQLVDGGAVEINIIAQDTTHYGTDLYGRARLAELLGKLDAELPPAIWLRLLYAYPIRLEDDVLSVMAGSTRICPYIDMPLQHISDRMLKMMRRPGSRSSTIGLLKKIRSALPDVAIRTAFIVGHPGETDADFHELLNFVKEGWFTHVGVFTYSPEAGTQSARLPDDVPEPVKAMRRKLLMDVSLTVVKQRNDGRVGTIERVMLDSPVTLQSGKPGWLARTRYDAPDVDGVVIIESEMPGASPGDVVDVMITAAADSDLIAESINNT